MEEVIDIIELLKRVKEGKAPKKIEIRGERFIYDYDTDILAYMYENDECNWYSLQITLDTKIKILDKPIIEELKISEGHTDLSGLPYTVYPTKDEIIEKINQIIRHINKEEK